MQPFKIPAAWQTALNDVITDPFELLQLLNLDPNLLINHEKVIQQFPLRVPRGFVARMKPNDTNDPLLRQVLPLGIELQEQQGFSNDPLHEKAVNPIPGLLHKYHGRVLLTLTGACGVNCRYCFRRHFPYTENNPNYDNWEQILDYIKKDHSIREVILSGGEPLLVSDIKLAKLTEKIAAIPHVQILRIHSRLPIVLPERVTKEFITGITSTRLSPVLAVHCNHPQEIDDSVRLAMHKLKQAGITLLNQAVLLKGINDSVEVLVTLSERLFAIGILPYYLNALDKVHGASHFAVSDTHAQAIWEALHTKLPGYLLPRFVREVPGASAKMPFKPSS